MILLQIDFPFKGVMGEEMSEAFKELAESIRDEKGLIWKIWTQNEETKEAGGIYLFEDIASAKEYMQMHVKRLNGFGVEDIRAKIFEVNEPLSKICKAPF